MENPAIDDGLARTARAMRGASRTGSTGRPIRRSRSSRRGDPRERRLHAAGLVGLLLAVGKRILARLVVGLDGAILDAILDLARVLAGGSRRLDLPGRSIWREYDDLVLGGDDRGRPSNT